ncbi:MAG: AAA family ATPase, partial [Treponema sp.]|nr:AAA family ATPase [Treponema sp.]
MNGLKLFPIGQQDFARIRRDGYYYVDKTAIIYEMVSTGSVYFLSRPRRFGKSLLVSTLKYYFEGRKDLFEGLAMEGLEKEWKKHPVFHVSFSISKYNDLNSLQITLNNILSEWEKTYDVTNTSGNEWGNRFAAVIKGAHDK